MEKGNVGFGAYLKSLRRDRRLTLERIEELTARIGEPISKTYLSRCEHGQTHPALPRLEALSRLYKVRLGELAERFELEQELARRPAGPVEHSLEANEAAERGIEAARRDDPHGALILFEAARRLLPASGHTVVPGAGSSCEPRPALLPSMEPCSLSGAGATAEPRANTSVGPDAALPSEPSFFPGAGHSIPGASQFVPAGRSIPGAAHYAAFPDAGRIASARSRLCLAVISGSVGNFRLCKDEAEALVCAEDLPEEIRQRATIQLAFAYRRLRRAALSRLVLVELLAKGESLPRRILADAHFLMGTLDLDGAHPRPALLHLRKAVSLYRAAGSQTDLCRALQELGEAYRLGGQLPEAMARYQEGLAIARKTDVKSLTADLLSHLGRGHFLAGNHSTAARYLFDSNDLARRGDYFDIQFRNYFYLRLIAWRQGDEFSRRTAERSLRMLLGRSDPLAEEAISFRQETALKRGREEVEDIEGIGEPTPSPAGDPATTGPPPPVAGLSLTDAPPSATSIASLNHTEPIHPEEPPRYRLAGRAESGYKKRTQKDEIVGFENVRQKS